MSIHVHIIFLKFSVLSNAILGYQRASGHVTRCWRVM